MLGDILTRRLLDPLAGKLAASLGALLIIFTIVRLAQRSLVSSMCPFFARR